LKSRRGKLIVGQSGGCTHVINASLQGVATEALRRSAVADVWGMRHGIEGLLRGDLVDLGRESRDTLRRVGRCPAAALGSCRKKMTERELSDVMAFLLDNDVRYFIYIGGNDSADTSHRIARTAARRGADIRVMAVPKTIDNDLPMTDHCPGYGSAARFLASVTADTGMETEAMRTVEPVKIIEVKGRNSGWLAASAALAKRADRDAPHIVWPPEVPFRETRFLRLVRRWLERIGYCVAVVTETVRDARGRPAGAKDGRLEMDAFGHPQTADAAERLCALVERKIGARARWDKPGSIQRMSSAHFSEVDLREARQCGREAVRCALRGATDRMVVLRRRRGRAFRVDCDTAPLARIANRERHLPAAFFDPVQMLPTPAFRRYALPLVGPGLPDHPRLRGHPPGGTR